MPCILVVLLLIISCSTEKQAGLKDGDILFQDFPSPQSAAVKLATQSQYSHCGIVFIEDGRPMVWEAVQPVCITPLDEWVRRDTTGHFVVKRLKGADKLFNPAIVETMQTYGRDHMGKDYDIYFAWSDEEFYCSELVWKMYESALGIEIAALRTLGDYDLSHPIVQAKMRERWGDVFPTDEPVVAPSDLFNSEMLQTMYTK
jgi:uncharacterized protein YycO